MSIWKQHNWIAPVGNLLGLGCLALGLAMVFTGAVSPLWLLFWPFMHMANAITMSAALHRYFCHGAFKTSKFWHVVMAFYSVTTLIGSPIAWSVTHIRHHVFSDKPGDSHNTHWTYMFWKRYHHHPTMTRRMRRLLKDPTVVFVHRFGLLIWLIFAAALLLVSWKLFLFGYGMALGSSHLVGSIHQIIAHKGGAPRDLPMLEYILPAGGEWLHKTHHEKGRKDNRSKWWHIDPGYWFIKAIETK